MYKMRRLAAVYAIGALALRRGRVGGGPWALRVRNALTTHEELEGGTA